MDSESQPDSRFAKRPAITPTQPARTDAMQGSMPAGDMQSATGLNAMPPVIQDPPVVVFQNKFEDPVEHFWSGAFELLREPAYGAQRVFDLFTLMAITLAFALLFGAMKALDASPEVFFGVTSFVTFVGIGQMLLFGGKSPRLASLVGGPLALLLTTVSLAIWYGRWASTATICSLIFGVPAGYLAGGMVAGVFLIADSLRARFTRPTVENEKDFWDED